jgi:hypothetical protein
MTIFIQNTFKSRDSSVGIELGYRLYYWSFQSPQGWEFFLHHRVQGGFGAHPDFCPMGSRGSFPGVKRPGREADHSPPHIAEVKKCVELYLHSPYTLSWHDGQLKKAQGQLYLHLFALEQTLQNLIAYGKAKDLLFH